MKISSIWVFVLLVAVGVKGEYGATNVTTGNITTPQQCKFYCPDNDQKTHKCEVDRPDGWSPTGENQCYWGYLGKYPGRACVFDGVGSDEALMDCKANAVRFYSLKKGGKCVARKVKCERLAYGGSMQIYVTETAAATEQEVREYVPDKYYPKALLNDNDGSDLGAVRTALQCKYFCPYQAQSSLSTCYNKRPDNNKPRALATAGKSCDVKSGSKYEFGGDLRIKSACVFFTTKDESDCAKKCKGLKYIPATSTTPKACIEYEYTCQGVRVGSDAVGGYDCVLVKTTGKSSYISAG